MRRAQNSWFAPSFSCSFVQQSEKLDIELGTDDNSL
jgi:hypothetical protein